MPTAAGSGGTGRPVATLFLGSGAAAVIVSVIDVLALGRISGIGRVGHLRLLRLLNRGLEQIDLDLLFRVRKLVNLPFDLARPGELARFLCLAIAVNLLLLCVVAAALAPAVAAAARRTGSRGALPRGEFWALVYALGVPVAFAVAGIQGLVRHLLGDRLPPLSWVVACAIAAAMFIGLLLTFRNLERVGQLVAFYTIFDAATILLATGAAAAATALGSDSGPAPAISATKGLPNILLISVDSLRADHLHCDGYPRETSPSIDALAREGVRFKTVVSSTSWTLPAHLTMLTSLPPEGHGVILDRMRLRPGVLTLAEALRRSGYATAGFTSGPYLEAEYGFSQGFEHYDDYSVTNSSPQFSHRGITSPLLLRTVGSWLSRWDREGRKRAFFIFLHMWDVHYDYAPPPPFDTMFDPGYRGSVTAENYMKNPQIRPGMDPRDLEHVIALYDGEIRFTDLHIGRLMEILKSVGVFDDTIVAATADHGEEFFEHGNKGHRRSLYDESLLVPLVIRYPRKVPAGKVVAQQVRLMDIAPTLIGIAGLKPPSGFGAPAPKGPNAERDLSSLIASDPGAAAGGGNSGGGAVRGAEPAHAFGDLHGRLACVRTERYKFIQSRVTGAEELFDLSADPAEQTNISSRISSRTSSGDPALDETLRKALVAWRESWGKGRGLSRAIELNEEQKERLRSLGYID